MANCIEMKCAEHSLLFRHNNIVDLIAQIEELQCVDDHDHLYSISDDWDWGNNNRNKRGSRSGGIVII